MKDELEGKSLEQDEKVQAFIEELKNLIKQSQELKGKTVESNGYQVSFDKEAKEYRVIFSETNILLAKEDKNDFTIYPDAINEYNKLAEQAEIEGVATLERPAGLVESKELEKFLQKQKDSKNDEQQEKVKDNEEHKEEGEEKEEKEKGDEEKPKLKDQEKEEIAEKYNVSADQVIHISMGNKKITEHDRFKDLVQWAGDKEDIYVLPGENEFTWKIVGRKKGEDKFTEIKEAEKNPYGQHPNITIKRIDGDQIEEVRPIAVYGIDSDSVTAIVRGEYGKPEMLYCRKEAGQKEFWGEVVPEASGKNVIQSEHNERRFMDPRNNSGHDLRKKADEFKKAQELDEKGVPSKKAGVQVYEIEGSRKQNRELQKDEIIRDLMNRDGITDLATTQPGYYKHKAEKILHYMKSDDLDYEQALEKVKSEEQRKSKSEEGRDTYRRDPRRG